MQGGPWAVSLEYLLNVTFSVGQSSSALIHFTRIDARITHHSQVLVHSSRLFVTKQK